MNGESLDLTEDLINQLKAIIPAAFSEGKLNVESLKTLIGEETITTGERYELNWPGKAGAYKVLQRPTTETLVPNPEDSINWDETENVFIEGENLAVLKVLQKSYYGKIKMIYIDPPYNTGSDSFIYPDKFSETREEYAQRVGTKDEDGYMMKDGMFRKNSKDSGHYHSNWLNMMLPRLHLARNLMTEDGVIFVSIDDNEQANLKLLMDQVFGEQNFLGVFVINSSPSAIDYGHIAKMHDYALFYARNIDSTTTSQLPEKDKEFKYEDANGPFNIYPLYNGNVAFNPITRPTLFYPFFLNPKNKDENGFFEISLEDKPGWEKVEPVVSKKDKVQRVWRWGKSKSQKNLNIDIVGYQTGAGEYRVVQKYRHSGKTIRSILAEKDVSSRRGTGEIQSLFGSKVFSFPKPTGLLKRFLNISLQKGDTVLDFFGGSGSIAHALLDLKEESGLDANFICVQLPEKVETDVASNTSEYETISEIAKSRIAKVIDKIKEERKGKLKLDTQQKLGFRKFTLQDSNFKLWRGDIDDTEKLQQQMLDFVTPEREGALTENILWELLVKNGKLLTEQLLKYEVEEGLLWSIQDGSIAFALDAWNDSVRDKLLELQPQKVIALDSVFDDNDAKKSNAQLQCEDAGISFTTV